MKVKEVLLWTKTLLLLIQMQKYIEKYEFKCK